MDLRIGCSGWFYRGWRGLFYPLDLKPSQWFQYYQSLFNTVEINSTYYRMPSQKNVRRWTYRLNPKFRFVVKAHRSITHYQQSERLSEFYEGLSPARPYIEAVLLQFPPSFSYDPERLDSYFRHLDDGLIHAIEFRSPDWFEKVPDFVKDLPSNVIIVSVSAPVKTGLPETLFMVKETVYIRFHGRTAWYRYDYKNEELEEWVEKIKKARPRKVFAFFNNDVHASAPRNALQFKQLLQQAMAVS